MQILCIIAAVIPTVGFVFALWRYHKSSVEEHSSGSEELTNAVFSFFRKCKLRCANAPVVSKDDLSQISRDLKWAGIVVKILVVFPFAVVAVVLFRLEQRFSRRLCRILWMKCQLAAS